MLTNKEYDALQNLVIKKFKKNSGESFSNMINDLDELDEVSYLCSINEMTYSSLLYQVKYLKVVYGNQLKEVIMAYFNVIFPDFSYKNDLNTMINGPYALKLWLLRYLCLNSLNVPLNELITSSLKEENITKKYQEIDEILFNNYIKAKVNN
ncbi:MAG: hypothetical protein SOU19_02120 [Candidatus Caccosoma sp.]|nr:hypothetical protein [Candidatus Caccosoma sp.]